MAHEVEKDQEVASIGEKFSMVFVGLVNNLFFLMVMSSSQRIIDHFKQPGKLGLVNWSCTFCGLFAGYINTMLSTRNFSYDSRFGFNAFCMAIGLLGCALSPSFWLSCVSILFVGFSCNFGESVTIGYLAYIKKQTLMKFWGIGTGIAGIMGSGYTVMCLLWGINYKLSFLVLLPLVLLYYSCYFYVLRQRPQQKVPSEIISNYTDSLVSSPDDLAIQNNQELFEGSCSLIGKIKYYITTCDITYFAQYVIAGAFLDCAQTPERRKMKFLFPLLGLTQHVGVLIFAGSLNLFVFPYLSLLSFLQIVNFFIWMSQAMRHWMPLWSEFVFVFLVGSVGGLSYVNTYYLILKDNKLSKKEQEIGSNLTAFSVTISVLISSCFTYISEETYLKPYVPV